MPIGAILGAVGGIAQMSSANRAAKAQGRQADRDAAFQTRVYDEGIARTKPFYDGGVAANSAYMFENGLAAKPAGYAGFEETPGQRYIRQQGIDGIQASAAANGGLFSAATMGDVGRANADYASTFRDQHLNRLAGLSDGGQQAAAMQSTIGSNAAAGMSNAFAAKGNAQAAGVIGVGNALNLGLENALAGFQYQKGIAGGNRGGGVNGNLPMFNGVFGGRGLGGFS